MKRFVRMREVMGRVGLKQSTIYKKMTDGKFPKAHKIGERSVAWLESDIDEWIRVHAGIAPEDALTETLDDPPFKTKPVMLSRTARMRLEAAAHHEAGHVVVAFHLGLDLGDRGVSIVANADELGSAAFSEGSFEGNPETDLSPKMKDQIERWIVVDLAGESSQRNFRPNSVRSHHGSGDRGSALRLLSFIASSDEEMEAYLNLLQIRTNRLVHLLRPKIEEFASELLVSHKLSAKQARDIWIRPRSNYVPLSLQRATAVSKLGRA